MNLLESSVQSRSYSKAGFMASKAYYLGMYKATLLQLYDMGYSSEPNVLDKEGLLTTLNSYGRRLRLGYGKSVMEDWYVATELFLVRKEIEKFGPTHDLEEQEQFLSLLLQALEFRNTCNGIDTYYSKAGVHKLDKKKKNVSWSFGERNGFLQHIGIRYGIPSGAYLSLISDSVNLVEVGYDNLYAKYIRQHAPEWYSPLLRRYYPQLVNSGAYLSGVLSLEKFGFGHDRLVWLKEQLNDLTIELSDIDSVEHLESPEFFGADAGSIYMTVKLDPYSERRFAYSAFLVDYDSGDILPDNNHFTGVTGDMVEISQAKGYSGCPISLVGSDGGVHLYVDSEQVLGCGESSLILDMGLKLNLLPRGSQELLAENAYGDYELSNGKKIPKSLVNFFYNSILLAEEGDFIRTLVGEWSWSLIGTARSLAYSMYKQKR